jgi:GDP-L-fucose synthase
MKMVDIEEFYRRKRVVVLGGAGFVGSHLVEKLIERGANVLVVDDNSRGHTDHSRAEHYFRDILDAPDLPIIFHDADIVFNLAASVAGVLYNQSHHLEMFLKNVNLQLLPLMIAAEKRVPTYLQVSSVCVYGTDQTEHADDKLRFYDLSRPTSANEGYTWGKRVGEWATSQVEIPHLVTVRPSNIYGPRDYFDDRAHVIPALIKKTLEPGNVIEAYGSGDEVREFLYVEDAAEGMIQALQKGEAGEVYNLGARGFSTSIRDLLGMIQRLCGTDKEVIWKDSYHPGDSIRYSNTFMLQSLGWQAKISLAEGLAKTIDWYNRRIVR